MGLGNRSLPSRAAGTDPRVTFPVVTVSGCPSLMLSVEGPRMSGEGAPPHPTPCSGLEDLTTSAAPPPLCHTGKGKSTLLTL